MRIPLILASLAFLSLARAPAAHACDPAEYLTPVDLYERADVVVLAKVTFASRKKVTLDVTETLKGTAGATVSVADVGSTCDPSFEKGARGVLFLDAQGEMVGLYDAFASAKWAPALRGLRDATTDAERAAPLVELAVSKDWTRSYQAAYALAHRDELIDVLDAKQRKRLRARAKKVARDHTLRELVRKL